MEHDRDKDLIDETSKNPRWWREEHTSAWTRIKEALRRDWEQTKHDFSKKAGLELDQDAGDTLKQMAGKQSLEWTTVEPAVRYGYGAGSYYKDDDFAARERDLEHEWDTLGGSKWQESRDLIKHGWEWSRRKD